MRSEQNINLTEHRDYSSATINWPPYFNPSYLALNLTEINNQDHFLTLLAISCPMVPEFA